MDAPYLSGNASDQPTRVEDLRSKRVLMFLTDGFEDAEAVCILDVMGWTHYRPDTATVSVDIAAFTPDVRGAFGTILHADVLVDAVDSTSYDALVVPGGFHNLGFEDAYDERVESLARSFADRACPIATLCVGAVPLARAGLLAGGRATTYALSSRHDNRGQLRANACEAVDEPVVEWNGIISCSGPAYSEQVAYLLLERLAGKQVADDVRRLRCGRAGSQGESSAG